MLLFRAVHPPRRRRSSSSAPTKRICNLDRFASHPSLFDDMVRDGHTNDGDNDGQCEWGYQWTQTKIHIWTWWRRFNWIELDFALGNQLSSAIKSALLLRLHSVHPSIQPVWSVCLLQNKADFYSIAQIEGIYYFKEFPEIWINVSRCVWNPFHSRIE